MSTDKYWVALFVTQRHTYLNLKLTLARGLFALSCGQNSLRGKKLMPFKSPKKLCIKKINKLCRNHVSDLAISILNDYVAHTKLRARGKPKKIPQGWRHRRTLYKNMLDRLVYLRGIRCCISKNNK